MCIAIWGERLTAVTPRPISSVRTSDVDRARGSLGSDGSRIGIACQCVSASKAHAHDSKNKKWNQASLYYEHHFYTTNYF